MCYINPNPYYWDYCNVVCPHCHGKGHVKKLVPIQAPWRPPFVPIKPKPPCDPFPQPWVPGPIWISKQKFARGDYE